MKSNGCLTKGWAPTPLGAIAFNTDILFEAAVYQRKQKQKEKTFVFLCANQHWPLIEFSCIQKCKEVRKLTKNISFIAQR